MAEHQADLPDKYILGDSWGLGWIRFGWDGQRLIGHDGNTIGPGRVPADPARAGPRGRAADQRRQHPRPLRGPLPRDLRRARRRRDAAAARAAARSRSTVDITPYVGTLRARLGPHGGAAARRPDAAHRRSRDRSPRWCPTRSTSTRWCPVGPALFVDQAAGGRDLGAGDLLRAADRRALRALRRARHAAGGLMDLTLLLADLRDAGRVRVAVGRPRRGGPLRRRRRPDRHAPGSGVAPERIVVDGRTHLRWRLGTGPSRVLVLGHHDTVWPLGIAGDAPVSRSRAACCAGRAAST